MVNFRYYTPNEDVFTIRCNALIVSFLLINSIAVTLIHVKQQYEQPTLSVGDIFFDIGLAGVDSIMGIWAVVEGYNIFKYIYPTQVHITNHIGPDLELAGQIISSDVVPISTDY